MSFNLAYPMSALREREPLTVYVLRAVHPAGDSEIRAVFANHEGANLRKVVLETDHVAEFPSITYIIEPHRVL